MSNRSFCTVLHGLKSPQNVGTIVRTHVAFGGGPVVFVGYDKPWAFKKGSQAFSRKLERLCELVFLADDDMFFRWCERQDYEPVAVEIAQRSHHLPDFPFPDRTAIVVGNEAGGLPPVFTQRCKAVVSIPHFGKAESLNVGVACAIAIYELNRHREHALAVLDSKYLTDAQATRVTRRWLKTRPK